MSEEPRRQRESESIRTSAPLEVEQFYEFGTFRLYPAERKLLRENQIVPLTPKAFDTLLLLVRNSGHLLEKDEILRALWPGTFVEEGSLSNNIFLLRKALGEETKFIETVPRRGYRFVGAVHRFQAASAHLGGLQDAPVPASVPAKAQWLWQSRAAAGLAAVGLFVGLVAAVWFYGSGRRGGKPIDSVAVLPFVNVGNDPNAEYLSDGVTENLIDRLSQLPHLRVMSRNSAFRFKGKQTDARAVGQALSVRAVLTGTVTQRGDVLDISVELVDARDDSHIWGEQFTRKSVDAFALQSQIAKEITAVLRVRLSGEEEKRLTKAYTPDPEAYQDYLKGHSLWLKATEESLNKSVGYFQQAIAKDPGYALAYSGLADSYSVLAGNEFVPPMKALPRAKEAALKAVELDDTSAEAHASLGIQKQKYDWDWRGAEREYQRAIELNPGYEPAHRRYGLLLGQMGRPEEAIAEMKRALEIDPLSVMGYMQLGFEFYFARKYDQAIEQEHKALELAPDYMLAHKWLGAAYISKSMDKEAVAEFEKMLALSPDDVDAISFLGYAYAVDSRRAEARKLLTRLKELSKHKYVPWENLAVLYVALGEKDKAIECFESSYNDGSIGNFMGIGASPMLDPLRSDPRFADLLRRMNLQP